MSYSFRLYLAMSDDGGATWSAPALVSGNCLLNDRPWLSTGWDGNVYLSYTERFQLPFGRKVVRIQPGTLNFDVASERTPQSVNVPIAVTATGEMFMVGNGSNEVIFWRSADGVTWTRQVAVPDCAQCASLDLGLSEDGELLIAYRQGSLDNAHYYVARSDDLGTTFVRMARMTGATPRTLPMSPRSWFIGDPMGGAHLLWVETDDSGTRHIQYSSWLHDQPEGTVSPTEVTDRPFVRLPDDMLQFTFGDNGLMAVWEGDASDGALRIYFSQTGPVY
jgi:hypothetical protein